MKKRLTELDDNAVAIAGAAAAMARMTGDSPKQAVIGLSLALAWLVVHCKRDGSTKGDLTSSTPELINRFISFLCDDIEGKEAMDGVVRQFREEANKED